MKCPACQQSLQENTSTCVQCGFDLLRAEGYFGIAPQLNSSVTDLAGVLSRKEMQAAADQLHQMDLQFPQCHFAAVLCQAPQQVPLGAYVFWLFNKGGLARPIETGGDCHLVLFLIDVGTGSCVCMVGYGLEPLLGADAMKRITDASLPQLEKGNYLTAIQKSMEQADKEFKELSAYLPRAFGLVEEKQLASLYGEEFAY